MASVNASTLKVKLNKGVIVEGAKTPRGEARYGKPGETHEFDRWTAAYLCHAGNDEMRWATPVGWAIQV